jgi:hypothetical protein
MFKTFVSLLSGHGSYVNWREKRKSCKIVVDAANYSTLFGFLYIRETTERLALFQLIAPNTQANTHITAASYLSRMLKFAIFSSQRLGLPQVYLWEKENEQLGTSQVSSAVTSDTRSIVSCAVLASENSIPQINEMQHFLLRKKGRSLRKYSLIYVIPPWRSIFLCFFARSERLMSMFGLQNNSLKFSDVWYLFTFKTFRKMFGILIWNLPV